MIILRNRNVIKTMSVIILSFFCFACLLPSPAHSTSEITGNQLKRDVGQVINDMICEILTPEMETRKLSLQEMEMTEGGSASELICNMITGGIGALCGAWAGGIATAFAASAVASGGITVVVSLVVGAALSTAIC